jgi:hypothetical protein
MILKNIKLNKYFFYIFFLLIFSASIFFKINFLSKVYTEYDDIGVIALHKGAIGDKQLKFSKYSFTIKEDFIKNLNQSFLFPAYIAYGWTYAPGQYMLIPFLNIDKKKYEHKIITARAISAFMSIISSILLIYICVNLLNLNKYLGLLIFCIYSFSLNLNMYSNHMSPVMTYSLCTIIGIIICIKSLDKKDAINIYSINTILILFSYTNIFFYFLFLYIEFRKKNLFHFFKNIFQNKKKLLLINILLLSPLIGLMLSKIAINAGDRGIPIDYNMNFLEIVKHISYQFNAAINSIQTGFVPVLFERYNAYFLILSICFAFFCFKKLNTKEKIIFEFLSFYLLIWIIMHSLKMLPLDQTRHSLIFFSIYLCLIGLILKQIKKINLISILIILALIVPAINLNLKNFKNKETIFDFSLIKSLNIKNIYTYSDTLSPFLYFEDDVNLQNIDLKSFRKNFTYNNNPEKIILVSQSLKLNDRASYDLFFKKFINMYSVLTIKEINNNIYMTHNNYSPHSTQNGFYLYVLTKKKL